MFNKLSDKIENFGKKLKNYKEELNGNFRTYKSNNQVCKSKGMDLPTDYLSC
jgi:hypothetical protein